jgi:glycosyltransferase involved in cell wall biosynthesis
MSSGHSGTSLVVAIVPVKNGADAIGATLEALLSVPQIHRIVVVDDGSTDGTADVICHHPNVTVSIGGVPGLSTQGLSATAVVGVGVGVGASVGVGVEPIGLPQQAEVVLVRLDRNVGKGGAVTAGIASSPDAEVFVLIDADLAATATIAEALLEPVLNQRAVMTIAVPTQAVGKRAGFGMIRRLAAWGIASSSGFVATAPLSGQRAIRADVLRSMHLADRFGLETGLTIDVAKAGHTVLEVVTDFDHRHSGRTVAGFRHRGRQGIDIVLALWERKTTPRQRMGLMIVSAVLFTALAIVTSGRWEPTSAVGATKASRVVIVGVPRLSLDDLGSGNVPEIDRLVSVGALGATSVRTLGGRPSTVEGYATLGAGARVRANDAGADAFAADAPVGLLKAAEVAAVRTGKKPSGEVVVVGMAQMIAMNQKRFLSSFPGALGDALAAAKLSTAVVNASDTGLVGKDPVAGLSRPAAISVADSAGSVGFGVVDGLLKVDATTPFGVRVDRKAFIAGVAKAATSASVTVVDTGELDRAFAMKAETDPNQFERLRIRALKETDDIIGEVVRALPKSTLIVVVSVRPPTGTWELTPTVLAGAGMAHGYLHSPSTRRPSLLTLTDVAPTVLDALGQKPAVGMIGHVLRVHKVSGAVNVGALRDMNALAGYRERIYLPLTKGYVIFQTIVYLLTMLLFSSRGGVGRASAALAWIVLAVAAWPLATFVFRAIPHTWSLGPFGGVAIVAIDLAVVWLARRRKSHPLAALSVVLFATAAINVVDLWTGAHLQHSSILGYSPHTAARFTGIGNAAFAALAATTILWASIHVHYARRRTEALCGAAVFCLVVFVADGAPMLGSDVGGILTLVPVFGLLMVVLSGRQLRARTLLYAGGATLSLIAVATGIDLLRPADQRSHLGRFAADIAGSGDNTFLTTIGRKLSTNIRVFTGSFWTWIVPVIALVLLFFLVVQRGWERDMPKGSALRAGVSAALLCGLLGFAVNDSGTVVTALVFVYLGPFITLLALDRGRHGNSSEFVPGPDSSLRVPGPDSSLRVPGPDSSRFVPSPDASELGASAMFAGGLPGAVDAGSVVAGSAGRNNGGGAA